MLCLSCLYSVLNRQTSYHIVCSVALSLETCSTTQGRHMPYAVHAVYMLPVHNSQA